MNFKNWLQKYKFKFKINFNEVYKINTYINKN